MKKMKITVSLSECSKFQMAILDCPQISKELNQEYSDVWMSDALDDEEYEELLCDVEDQLQTWGVSEFEIEDVESDDEECMFRDLDPGFSSWADYNRYMYGY